MGNSANLSAFIANSHDEAFLQKDCGDVWFMDSGASRHMSFRCEWFRDFKQCDGERIALGDNVSCRVKGEGTIRIKKRVNGRWRPFRLERVLYVPDLRKNLFSVGVCTEKRLNVMFSDNKVEIFEGEMLVAGGGEAG